MAVVTTINSAGQAHSTVVSACVLGDKMAFVSRGDTLKIKHVRKTGRCAITVIKGATMRYATVEGPAEVRGFDNTDEASMLALLREAYATSGRDPAGILNFEQMVRDENRMVILITPEHVYGSLRDLSQPRPYEQRRA